MSDGERRTAAVRRHSRWPGWIWAIPIAAAIIVGWLVLRHVINRGPEVTVSFADAGGVQAGNTKVKYKGLDVGEVEDVVLAGDLSHVVLTLRLDDRVENALNEGTRFWIVGASVDPSHLSALETIVSGPYVEMDPGQGKPTRRFTGLERPAPVAARAKGTRFVLHARELGSVGIGASLKYLGLDVGTVEAANLVGNGQGFDIAVFVRAPYDKLVHQATRFWNAGALSISTSSGLKAALVSLPALVSGAIAFENIPEEASSPLAKSGGRFELYGGRDAALGAPIGQRIPYTVRFSGAVGDLQPGAAVRLRGFRVGTVTGIGFDYEFRADTLETPVAIELEPARLKLEGGAAPADGDWTDRMNQALGRMVERGLRARLDRTPPVIGAEFVSLDFVTNAAAAHLVLGGLHPEIPAAASSDLGAITSQAQDIMGEVGKVPFAAIGGDLRQAVEHVRALIASPALADSLHHLDQTLASLEETARQVRGKTGPVLDSVHKAADAAQQAAASANAVLGGGTTGQDNDIPQALQELTRAARSIRSLANYLDQHPEALIEGRTGASK